jgi:hypothetical protein
VLQQLFDIIAPVLACAAIGFAWKKANMPFDMAMVTQLVTNIATPCLILASLTKLTIDMASFGQMALAMTLAVALFLALGWLGLRLAGLPAHTFLPAVALGNTGNLGLPLCLFAFGERGLALGIALFAVNSMAQFTLGQAITAGSLSLGRLVRTPVIYALALALVLMATGTRLPTFLDNAVGVLGQMAIPLMLLALGVSLASLGVGTIRLTAALAAARLLLGMGVGLFLGEVLALDPAERGTLIIQCAMPAAVFNYLWAQHYGRDAAAVAGIVVLSTAMSFLLLPLVLALALDPTLLPWR